MFLFKSDSHRVIVIKSGDHKFLPGIVFLLCCGLLGSHFIIQPINIPLYKELTKETLYPGCNYSAHMLLLLLL